MRKFFRRKPHPKLFHHAAYLENVLGTSLEIQVVSEIESDGARAEAAILAEIDRLELIFNAYNPRSELRRWQATFDQNVAVSRELAQLLADAENWRVRSHNAFNPAVEALTQLWARHECENRAVAPDEIAALVAKLNAPLWEVDDEKCTARRLTDFPATLNSIAKGFIIDRACDVAARIESAREVLVNIGGDLRHCGSKPLSIAVADPRDDAENAVPVDRIRVYNQGLATSGDYRRGFQIGERHFSHLLDPRTGWPVEDLIGVSVVAPDAATSDVLATVFSVLTPQQSLEFADELANVGALLVDKDGARFCNDFWRQARVAS